MLYSLTNNQVTAISENPFKLEKDIQSLTEANLDPLFGLEFVSTEFPVANFRLDTLAYDPEAQAFAIIEYKRDKNFSVIDQGYAYLAAMLNNKADFVLEYNEKTGKTLKRDDIEWSQSRILFISPAFTVYQKEAISFKDIAIELWEVKRYANDTVSYTPLTNNAAQATIKSMRGKNKSTSIVDDEIVKYTEDDHLTNASEATAELYEQLKLGIIALGDDIIIQPRKLYIGFKGPKSFVDIHIRQNNLKLWLNMPIGSLDDPKGLARDVSQVGHWGNGDYEIVISDDSDIEYVLGLIRQSHENSIGS